MRELPIKILMQLYLAVDTKFPTCPLWALPRLSRLKLDIVCVIKESGEKFLYQMKEVGELQVVEENLMETSQALGSVCSVLQQLNLSCGELEDRNLYPAFKILEKIRSTQLGER